MVVVLVDMTFLDIVHMYTLLSSELMTIHKINLLTCRLNYSGNISDFCSFLMLSIQAHSA